MVKERLEDMETRIRRVEKKIKENRGGKKKER